MQKRIASDAVDLIVYDFDGVMTDNRVIVLQDGSEAVVVNRADGLGIQKIRAMGIPQIILSTETNPVVKARAIKLGLESITGCQDKREALLSFCSERGCNLKRVVYVGNDVNDLSAMQIIGFPIAPADAHQDITRIAYIVTTACGGGGVIKELSECIDKSPTT